MLRHIVEIDEEKCTGCGLCAEACHEGAIGMVDGKASKVTSQAASTLKKYGANIQNVYYIGGTKAINNKVRSGVNYIIKKNVGTSTAKKV